MKLTELIQEIQDQIQKCDEFVLLYKGEKQHYWDGKREGLRYTMKLIEQRLGK